MAAATILDESARGSSGNAKKRVDIEALLSWAYLDELSKRAISSAEGIWDGIGEYLQRGGVDVGHGAAQRYPHFGLPHQDAEAIERAVSVLGRVAVDWAANFEVLGADLAALVSFNELEPPPKPPSRERDLPGKAGYLDPSTADPHYDPRRRDVVLVNSINVAALVTQHAVMGTRPDWRTEQMRVVPMPAERGPLAKVIGVCKGKNRYSSGAYCPLRWEPSPVEVVRTRADYAAWHGALSQLAATLSLKDHVVLPPAAPALPWASVDRGPARWLIGVPVAQRRREKPLPLKPERERAAPPLPRPRNSAVRGVREEDSDAS